MNSSDVMTVERMNAGRELRMRSEKYPQSGSVRIPTTDPNEESAPIRVLEYPISTNRLPL